MSRFFVVVFVVAAGCIFKGEQPSAACQEYCDVMQENCPGAVFGSFDECVETCAQYPSEPEDLDESGVAPNDDTVECRIYHANNAAVRPDGKSVHCTHASPGGGGVCVAVIEPCGAYCGKVVEFCAGTEGAIPSTDECLEFCNGLARGEPGKDAGNTAQCRLTWADRANIQQDKELCVNAGIDSPACVN